ncbi:MAG: hypothetical protein ACFFDW_09685 [Candidatus Thorarchaeota archaeon]
MALSLNKNTMIKAITVSIVIFCMFQQQVFDGTSKSEIRSAEPQVALNPTPTTEFSATVNYDYSYPLVGNWSDSGSVYKVVVEGDYAYIADGLNGFRILDVSNRSEPTEVGYYKSGTATCYDVVVSGSFAYLAYGINGIVILDITNKASPNVEGQLNTYLIAGNQTTALDVDTNYIYTANGKQGMEIISIAEKDHPTKIGNGYHNNYVARDIVKKEYGAYKYVFITFANLGMRILDVSNVINPVQKGLFTLSGNPYGLFVEFTANKRYAYIADDTGYMVAAFWSVDNIVTDSGYNLINSKKATNVFVKDNKTYVTYSTDGLKMFNIFSPQPYINGTAGGYVTGVEPKAIFVDDHYGYISKGSGGLDIILFDADFDGLYSGDEEYIYLCDPNDDDTDDDGLDDGEEIYTYKTDPNLVDTDNDLISDGEEVVAGVDGFITKPLDNDTDDDLLLDGEEVYGVFCPTNTYANLTGFIRTNAPLIPDVDGDTLKDGREVKITLTNPFAVDSEGDGMNDNYEVQYGLDPNVDDSLEDKDLDGLVNIDEKNRSTNPTNPDSDSDKLKDGEEVHGIYYPSNPYANATGYIKTNAPLNSDIDKDGLKDGDEVKTYLTNPLNDDSDFDGLTDYEEVITHLTNPQLNDTDADTLPDYWEVTMGTDPFTDDTGDDLDSDGLTNLQEYNYGTDPLNDDSDDDGMDDGYEIEKGFDPNLPDSDLDNDHDGLTNLEEYNHGTNPFSDDTDNDGMDDKWEVDYGTQPTVDDADDDPDEDDLTNIEEYEWGTDPLDEDTDNDGLLDGEEVHIYGTNPKKYDTDGDNFSDKEEIDASSDPLNPNSTPRTKDRAIYLIVGFSLGTILIISASLFFTFFYFSRPDKKMLRYLKQQKEAGVLVLSTKQISEYLQKRLNRGEVKQIISQHLDDEMISLEENRVWLTNREDIEDRLADYKLSIAEYKESTPKIRDLIELKTNIENYSKAASKLGFTDLIGEFKKLQTELETIQTTAIKKAESLPIAEKESIINDTFKMPELNSSLPDDDSDDEDDDLEE